MSIIEATVATTNVDSHNERMTVEALQSMVDAVNESYIPLGIEHDPRIPPQGRVIKAWLEQRDDGATAVKAEIEVFDGEHKTSPPNDAREIRIKTFVADQLLISFDRNFRGEDDQELLSRLAESLDAKLQEEFKKALDPISVLAIGGAFLLGGIAKGFLSKLGSDGYDLLKETLKKLFGKSKPGEKERLLVLEFEVSYQHERFIVEVIATNPTQEDIDTLLSVELRRLDSLVQRVFRPDAGLRKLVYELKDKNVALQFGVRRDGVPLKFTGAESEPNSPLQATRHEPPSGP